VAQGVDPDTRDEVQILVPVNVVDVASFAAIQHQRVPGIVLNQKLALEIDDLLRRGDTG